MPNSQKSMQPPEVQVTSAGLVNWTEFERWARLNVPLWNTVMYRCALVGLRDAHVKIIAYQLTIENRRMKDALIKHAQETGKPIYIPQ